MNRLRLPRNATTSRRWVAIAAIAGTVGLATTACTPDTTRGRIEHDVPLSFANAYRTSQQIQGARPVEPQITGSECHSSVNLKQDSGPGSWDCQIGYTVDGSKKSVELLVLVDQLGCYQAMNTDNRDATIPDKATGVRIPDPKVGFDGCFDVYDSRTDTSKK